MLSRLYFKQDYVFVKISLHFNSVSADDKTDSRGLSKTIEANDYYSEQSIYDVEYNILGSNK